MIKFLLPLAAISLVSAKNPATTVLNEWPVIYAHDAATTYWKGIKTIKDWAQTQPGGGVSVLMDCGTRALDWRPKLDSNGNLIMHHGDFDIHHPMANALDEMIEWASKHRGVEDLVFLHITHCESANGKSCEDAVEDALSSRHITSISDCRKLEGMTVSKAYQSAKLPGGGAILAVFDCWESNWVPDVACSGYKGDKDILQGIEKKAKDWFDKLEHVVDAATDDVADLAGEAFYTCSKDSSTKKFPFDRMWQYVDKTTGKGPPKNGELWGVQTFWQETTGSVAVGEVLGSSLLDEESRSQLNALVTARIRSGDIDSSKLNFLGVNNVCNGGTELHAVLRSLGTSKFVYLFQTPQSSITTVVRNGRPTTYVGGNAMYLRNNKVKAPGSGILAGFHLRTPKETWISWDVDFVKPWSADANVPQPIEHETGYVDGEPGRMAAGWSWSMKPLVNLRVMAPRGEFLNGFVVQNPSQGGRWSYKYWTVKAPCGPTLVGVTNPTPSQNQNGWHRLAPLFLLQQKVSVPEGCGLRGFELLYQPSAGTISYRYWYAQIERLSLVDM